MNYDSHKKYFLIFAALIIGIKLLNIPIPEYIPFTEIKFPPSNVSIVLLIVMLYFGIYTVLSWVKLEKQQRSFLDISITLLIGITALSLEIPQILSNKGLTWQNSLATIAILILGILPAITFDLVIAVMFSLRGKEEASRLGLGRLPSASKAFLRAITRLLLPLLILASLSLHLIHSKLPHPIDQYYKHLFFIPTLLLNFETVLNLILCLGPRKIRTGAINRIRFFKRGMDLHEMHYQHIGIEKPKKYESTTLCALAETGDVISMRNLLNNGVDPNEQDSRGWSPLMFAAAENKVEAAGLLIEHGANTNLINYLGRTALMYASRYGYTQIVQLLLKAGAKPNTTAEFSNFPSLLVAAENGHLAVVELLLEYGADVTHTDKNGETALSLAMKHKHGEVAKILRTKLSTLKEQERPLIDSSMAWIKKDPKK